ncbi:murein DD-endopeptidase MepM/ murein hydrolase activator NlpD [Breznakia sp. PF5-3]|uniref:M23 family metallopeptidase n=1 Tax=unclassified Breznakia TaxID=2623764 RepID=UPI0024076E44|nr:MULTISPECIES: M23 family metallopeptidase [unclassified Breznakia]MDF9824516.1 murein DD-endopeptidase MepM/ murein hydrolase activator NlpD [Breznakia sp. PM6-1]MDF9835302.1 murein DD-endopeptidase MepM/ murein hydrolase activator NlpD [Breznakia sp. PF5-3]
MMYNPIIIQFPLRGEWYSPTTPASKIPSHGTNRMGLRYAFDFLQVDWQNHRKFYHASFLRYLLFGVPLKKCICWGQPIHAPADGKIVYIKDGIPERKIVHWLIDSILALKHSTSFNENVHDYSKIAGNYIMMKCDNGVYMAFAHLQTNSTNVSINDEVKKGDIIGNVGHSGNSTGPHLHFQLMDSANIKVAKGIPCLFEKYEIFQDNKWTTIYNSIPSKDDQFRFID